MGNVQAEKFGVPKTAVKKKVQGGCPVSCVFRPLFARGLESLVRFCPALSGFYGFRVFVLLCRALPSRSLARFRATGNNGRGRRNMKIKSESRAALAAMLSALGIPGDKQERAFAIMEGGDDYAPADVGRVIRAREVAERLGVSGRTVRLWGRKGLLRPVTGSGSRFKQ